MYVLNIQQYTKQNSGYSNYVLYVYRILCIYLNKMFNTYFLFDD